MAMVTDPVADLLTRIRNGSLAEHEKVDIPSSKLKVRLAEIPRRRGSSRTSASSRTSIRACSAST